MVHTSQTVLLLFLHQRNLNEINIIINISFKQEFVSNFKSIIFIMLCKSQIIF